MEISEKAPLCTTCNHHHEQGVRCHICGHIGKSHIYPKMRAKAAERRLCKIESLDGSSLHDSADFWALIIELREILYCREFGYPQESEIDEDIESISRHYVCFVGDAPVAVARIRPHSNPDESDCRPLIIIDRLAVLPDYRSRGIGKLCMSMISENIRQTMAASIGGVRIFVPLDSWIQIKCESIGMRVDERFPLLVLGKHSLATIICDT